MPNAVQVTLRRRLRRITPSANPPYNPYPDHQSGLRSLEFAREQSGRPDWRFELVSQTAIPCGDGEATACAAFSLFTHLPETTCVVYLREMRRVLKPGGLAIFSFLDPSLAAYDRMLKGGWTKQLLRRTLYAPNIGYSSEAIADWARRTGFNVARIESVSALGQSLAVFEA